ncbi:hypothetical protein F5J12DRAFT_896562 [Pisolithus orientalis]|uniref:uncharacterized protein n=1 Tax=Pisolithus orientalis TaxID=936130 RepID=UPI0022258B8A|nr:uncharacterized protein F5J12DRAFT_896562 [Pisolithus orientalis]KAI5995339.1 hypothetical protein F5J12DRAFT_896562 [Pisolithus orientalis]
MNIQKPFTELSKPLEGGVLEDAAKGPTEAMDLKGGYRPSSGSLQESKEPASNNQQGEAKFEEMIRGLSEEFRKLKLENVQLRTSTQDLLAENAALREAIQQEQKENTALQRALRKEEEERLVARRLLNRARERQEVVRVMDRQARTETDALRRQLSAKELEIKAIKRESNEMGPDSLKVTGLPQGCQAKMATEGDVHSLLTALNTEIMETCLAIVHSESFAFARQPTKNIDEECFDIITEHFPESVMGWLREQLSSIDHLALEIVLKDALVAASSWVISERDPDLEGIEPTEVRPPKFSDGTTDLWGWLVHIAARGSPCNALRHTLQRSISKVLIWTVMRPAGYVSNDTVVHEFSLKTSEQLTTIIDLALRLNEILRRGGAKELWLLRGVPGGEFDSNMMDDFGGLEGNNQINGTVVGTTALGLCRVVIRRDIYSAELHLDPLIKPKVVLRSFLDSLQPEDEGEDEDLDEAPVEDLDEASVENADEDLSDDADEASVEDLDEASVENADEDLSDDADEASVEDLDEASVEDADEDLSDDADEASVEDLDEASVEDADEALSDDVDEYSTEDWGYH